VSCPFCAIVAGEAPAEVVDESDDYIAIVPLNPVTPGHVLAIPKTHVESAVTDPVLTGLVTAYASRLARDYGRPCNIITSVGRAATQTVLHLHVHVVPRRVGDGLPLPWTPQQLREVS
jgi:histidine triad (HIT) family protein